MIDNLQNEETEAVEITNVSAHATKVDVETVDSRGKRTKRKSEDAGEIARAFARGDYGPDYERRKAEVHREINERVIKPEDLITGETWKKTPAEREELAIARARHNALLRSYGVNPKKQMNVTPQDEINFAEKLKTKNKPAAKKVAKK